MRKELVHFLTFGTSDVLRDYVPVHIEYLEIKELAISDLHETSVRWRKNGVHSARSRLDF